MDLPWLQYHSHSQGYSRNNLYKYSPSKLKTSPDLYHSKSKVHTNHSNSSKTRYSNQEFIQDEPIKYKSKTNHASQYIERIDIVSGRIRRECCLCYRCSLRLETRCLGKASIAANKFTGSL